MFNSKKSSESVRSLPIERDSFDILEPLFNTTINKMKVLKAKRNDMRQLLMVTQISNKISEELDSIINERIGGQQVKPTYFAFPASKKFKTKALAPVKLRQRDHISKPSPLKSVAIPIVSLQPKSTVIDFLKSKLNKMAISPGLEPNRRLLVRRRSVEGLKSFFGLNNSVNNFSSVACV